MRRMHRLDAVASGDVVCVMGLASQTSLFGETIPSGRWFLASTPLADL